MLSRQLLSRPLLPSLLRPLPSLPLPLPSLHSSFHILTSPPSQFIGGEWAEAQREPLLDLIDPASEDMIGKSLVGGRESVDKAVKSARKAFEGPWGSSTGPERAEVLKKIAFLLSENRDELARVESLNCGKPYQESLWDVDDSVSCFQYYASLAEKMEEGLVRDVELSAEHYRSKIAFEPCGVVGAIVPWNYPLLMATWKIAPALGAGCTVVLKPSELTPLTSLMLCELMKDAELPPGVLNVVTGDERTGASLSSHPGIDLLSFTGSLATGRKVMEAAAKNVVPVCLELGGKSPIIVFDDVDVEKAVEWTLRGFLFNGGQVCSSTSRLVIHSSIADRFLSLLTAAVKKTPIGRPLSPRHRDREAGMLGPMVSQAQLNRVVEHLRGAQAEGARFLTGAPKRHPTFIKGFFVQPAVLEVTPEMKVWKEEVFGPVLSVVRFDSEEEGIELCNDSQYGLAAAVLTDNAERQARMAKALKAGTVWVNCSQPCFPEASFGGVKRSGFGRELGLLGLMKYLTSKQITSFVGPDITRWFLEPPKEEE